jgi:hypothetical protein
VRTVGGMTASQVPETGGSQGQDAPAPLQGTAGSDPDITEYMRWLSVPGDYAGLGASNS